MMRVRRRPTWDARQVRALRQHLGFTQTELSAELGVRQQTVSEWETGAYQPRGASSRLLTLVAERAAFAYTADDPEPPPHARQEPAGD
jgi:DNA-binding transcriptional regulator YiaG